MQTQMMFCAAVTFAATLAGPVQAQRPDELKRTILQTFDVPGSDYQTVIGSSELGPNGSVARQSHPGPEAGYVLQGSGSILVDGKPPIALEAGGSYQLAPGAAHAVRSGPQGVKLIVTWVVKKGEPLASPAN